MNSTPPAVLDCTLRDGGYYTAWDFQQDVVGSYLRAASKLPISTIELGYCNLPRDGYFGQYYFLNEATTARAKGILREDQRLAVMLDEKSVPLTSLDRVVGEVIGTVDLVRMAVAPTRLAEAAALGRRLRELGFDVAINIMYLSKYWDSVDSLSSLSEAAEVSSCLALVDSYGGCTPEQVAIAISSLRELHPQTAAGFHGHDNMRLAFANSLSAVTAGATIIDSTVTGMGRGPGNTQTETLLVHKYAATPDELDYVALHDIVDPFEKLQREYGWGTNLVYMISGAAGLPQNRVMDWLGKNRYSVPSIIHAMQNQSLGSIDEFSYETLGALSANETDELIVIGGGPTIEEHAEAVVEYANRSGATVVHANYRHLSLIERLTTRQYVALAGDVVDRLPDRATLDISDGYIVPAAPRIRPVPEFARARTRQVQPFVVSADTDNLGPVSDIGPLSLALGAALANDAARVTLVGFDGYAHATSAEQELAKESQLLLDAFRKDHPEREVTSGTRTRFDVPVASIYSRLSALASDE
ncbi:hypothetical protein GCM10023065_06300 [Microbacterium laevaniformans]|uniref:hypothetical protein n=1 Tax=Microbacterium laevaniformans TaxID=36807 RepID=UPI00195CFDBE|nr:hypothetical protein [Microbacterium laevaniformans]MBM7751585.1 4-hydroxy 2-oxovalerate aldolase [Microbacterium laevaniformans]GLJ63744.1 hypothetical protein GCM10017578_06310 [Microbacterium laevaniformans]